MNNLWINKYKPNNLNEIIGNKNQIKRIEEWLKNIDTLKSMSLIVSGNHGIGKSLTLKYILEENNLATQNLDIVNEMEDILEKLKNNSLLKNNKQQIDDDKRKKIQEELKKLGYIS